MHRDRIEPRPRGARLPATLTLLLFLAGCGGQGSESPDSAEEVPRAAAEERNELIEQTEAVVDGVLPAKLRGLNRSVLNMELPLIEATDAGSFSATRMIGMPVWTFWCISSSARGRSSNG